MLFCDKSGAVLLIMLRELLVYPVLQRMRIKGLLDVAHHPSCWAQDCKLKPLKVVSDQADWAVSGEMSLSCETTKKQAVEKLKSNKNRPNHQAGLVAIAQMPHLHC